MYLYIIAIGWAYVVLLMSATAKSFVAGVMTFLFFGLLPLALVLWLTLKRMQRLRRLANQRLDQPDRTDTQPDQ